jgi:4-hydroxyproline epimerase
MRVIDSHTEGEPTRVVVDGGPSLGDGPLAERSARFAREFDHLRRFTVTEPPWPRGNGGRAALRTS